jgi:hypothetical protein
VLLAECLSPHVGGEEASGATASRGGGLGGVIRWQSVAAAVALWAGDGVGGIGWRGTEDADSGLAKRLLAAPRLGPA